MKIYIIESDSLAVQELEMLLKKFVPGTRIVGRSGSVSESIRWFSDSKDRADIVFMSVELSDGTSFDILENINIDTNIIMIAKNDRYAIQSFGFNCVDYLIKPINPEALKRAIIKGHTGNDICEIAKSMASLCPDRKRLLIRLNAQIYPIEYSDIAYLYSENKSNFLITKNGESYIVDKTMNELEKDLNANDFFRVSRMCIISRGAITDYYKVNDSRYSVIVSPRPYFNIEVSLSRSNNFIKWIKEGNAISKGHSGH